MGESVLKKKVYPHDKFAWFKRGRDFIVMEVPNEDNTLNEPDDPTVSITNGIEIEYTSIPQFTVTGATDPYTTELPCDDMMAYALLDFVKAKIHEDGGDVKLKEYYIKSFRQKVKEADDNKVAGLRQFQSSFSGGIK